MRRPLLLLGVLVVLLALWYRYRLNVVLGTSMEPTLVPWELCISLRTRPYEPRRGDIVAFRTSDEPPLYFVKRVVALPGETISIENGSVKINGQLLEEPYTKVNAFWNLPRTAVSEGKIYVLSDNREAMFEDYVQGMVATRLVQSRLLWHGRFR